MSFQLGLLLFLACSVLHPSQAHHVKGHEGYDGHGGFKPGFPGDSKSEKSVELPKDVLGDEPVPTPEVLIKEEPKDELIPIIPDGTKEGDEVKPEVVDVKKELPVDEDKIDMEPELPEEKPEIPMIPMDDEMGPLPDIPLDEPPKKTTPDMTLYEICRRLGLRRFLYLMRRAGLGNLLFRPGSYRMFVPTDEAFHMLPFPIKARLLSDSAYLRRVLLYHMMDGSRALPDKKYGYMKTKSPGLGIHMNYYGGKMCVNGVPLNHPAVKAVNGEVHVMDTFIGPLPVGNLAQGLQSAGVFTRLYVLAVEAGILEKELSGEGPYTLFAPTDAAFKKLPREILEWLSWDNEALKDLLLKHIASGVHYTSGVEEGKPLHISTLGGGDIEVKKYEGGMTVNGVEVVRADLPATNGVMHAIDEVMFTSGLQPRKRPPSLLAARRRIYPTTT